MHGIGTVIDGQLFLDKTLHDYLLKHEGQEVNVELMAITKPMHYLYKYLFGYLIKDIVAHTGQSEDEVVSHIKEQFATEYVNSWEDVPPRHRKKCDRFERVKYYETEDGGKIEHIERFYIKSLSKDCMTHEELIDLVKKVDNHFFDFLEGAMYGSKERQLQMHELRKVGMMSDEEFKEYKANKRKAL